MTKTKLKILALLVVLLLSSSAKAQQVSIANVAPPPGTAGSPYLTFGDIVAATRGGTAGLGGGTTYGMTLALGGTCTTGQYVSTISSQGVPSCSLPAISTGTTFTIASGCATATTLVGGIYTGQFTTGGTSCSPVLTLPTAPNGWFCTAWDITTNTVTFKETAKTATSCTLTASTTTGASDVIVIHAEGY